MNMHFYLHNKAGVYMIFSTIENEQDTLMLERLYDKYKGLMYVRAYDILRDKYLAEDAVHQSFIRIIDNLHKIDEHNCPRTKKFLVIICENISKTIYRTRVAINAFEEFDESIDSVFDLPNDCLDIVIDRESVKAIEFAIENLSPIYRDVLQLKKAFDCTNGELVKLLGVPLETVKKRLYRAKNMLAHTLQMREEIRK